MCLIPLLAHCASAPDSYRRYTRAHGATAVDEDTVDIDSEASRRELVRFCADRAEEVIESATAHRADDLGLLVSALLVSGIGAGLNGVAGVLGAEGTSGDAALGFTVAGIGSIAVGSLFFGIRAGVSSDPLQRAERTAADQLVMSATEMIDHIGDDAEFALAAEDCAEALDLIHGAYASTDGGLTENDLEQALEAIHARLAGQQEEENGATEAEEEAPPDEATSGGETGED